MQTSAILTTIPKPTLSQGVVSGQPPHTNRHISQLKYLIKVFMSILKSRLYKLCIAHGFVVVTSNRNKWEVFLMPWPSPTLCPLGPSHQHCHKSRLSHQGLFCAHGVSCNPYDEVRNKDYSFYPQPLIRCGLPSTKVQSLVDHCIVRATIQQPAPY